MPMIPMTLPTFAADDDLGPQKPDWAALEDAQQRTLDALAGFDKMADHAEPSFAPIVEAFRELHRRHGYEMKRMLIDAGRAPADDGSMIGTVNQLVVVTRALFDDIDADLLEQIHRDEEQLVRAYQAALMAGLPGGVSDRLSHMLAELSELLDDTRPSE